MFFRNGEIELSMIDLLMNIVVVTDITSISYLIYNKTWLQNCYCRKYNLFSKYTSHKFLSIFFMRKIGFRYCDIIRFMIESSLVIDCIFFYRYN